MHFNIICASNNKEILNRNLADSAFFQKNHRSNYVMKGFNNVSKAYEAAMHICFSNDYNLFVHQDVYLPEDFETNLVKAINQVNFIDPNWGVLGVYGATIENGQRKFYGHVRDRGHNIGTKDGLPKQVQTLDELLLITKGDFVFDEQFDLHFYGADICLQAISKARKNYAIDAYCHHNSTLRPGERTDCFRACEEMFKTKWQKYLPVATTCSLIPKSSLI